LRNTSPVSLTSLATMVVRGISLLFLVAGAGTCFVLERRSPRQFIGERGLRLFIPFASLTLIPLQDYAILHADPNCPGCCRLNALWSGCAKVALAATEVQQGTSRMSLMQCVQPQWNTRGPLW